MPAPGSDVQLQIDALRQQNDLILKLLCGNPNTPQQFCEKKVFVTSTVHINGNLAGLQGADDICNSLASSAELPGTYKAWLSDDAASPNTRFAKSTEPYVLVDGTLVASSYADLTDGSLQNAIDLDETGSPVPTSGIWTATNKSGDRIGDTCDNWTSSTVPGSNTWVGVVPDPSPGAPRWTDDHRTHCGNTTGPRLYCFEQ